MPHKAAQAPEGDPDTWDASDDSAGQGFTVDSLEELKGQKIFVTVSVVAGRGFPPDRCSHNFVKYRFFVEEVSIADTAQMYLCSHRYVFACLHRIPPQSQHSTGR